MKMALRASLRGPLNYAIAAVCALAIASPAAAQSILTGNFLPNPDMETETLLVPHRTEGPTDNSFAHYWHHSLYSGWNDLTPTGSPGPAVEPVISGIHSLRLFDFDTDPPSNQGAYYFAPNEFGAGSFTQEEHRTFATAIPFKVGSTTDRIDKMWVRWHWNYDMTFTQQPGADPSVTFNIRLSNAPVVALDLVGSITDNKTSRTGTSNGQWEQVTVEIDLTTPNLMNSQSFDLIVLTEGSDDALGLMWVDDVSVSAIDPNAAVSDADFDNDLDVDGNDLLILQRGLGGVGTPTTGDADGDNDVDNADLTIFRNEFGMPQSTVASMAIPEPSSWMLAIVGCAAVARKRRHRMSIHE